MLLFAGIAISVNAHFSIPFCTRTISGLICVDRHVTSNSNIILLDCEGLIDVLFVGNLCVILGIISPVLLRNLQQVYLLFVAQIFHLQEVPRYGSSC